MAGEWWRTEPAIAVCAAVSSKRGLICYMMRSIAFNKEDFIQFLSLLKSKTPDINK